MSVQFYHYYNEEDLCKTMSHEESSQQVSNFLRKWLTVENFNVLIGSGCSFPAINLMNITFKKSVESKREYYNKITYEPFINAKKSQLKQRGIPDEEIKSKLSETINIEEYLDWLNQAILFHENIDNDKYDEYRKAFRYMIESLVESMESRPEAYVTEDYIGNLNLYKAFYLKLFQTRSQKNKTGNVNVFTSNYDLFNEVALEQLNIHYTTGFKGGINRKFTPSMFKLRLVDDENRYKEKWDPVRKFVKLFKIHGSLNWFENENHEIVQLDNTNEKLEKRMIYPYVSKHNLTRQTPYSELFREFSINVQKNNSVLFIMGYGFPDEHINQIIKQGIDNPDITIIIFGNMLEEGLKRFLSNVGTAQNIHVIGGVDEGGNHIGHHFQYIVDHLGGVSNDGF